MENIYLQNKSEAQSKRSPNLFLSGATSIDLIENKEIRKIPVVEGSETFLHYADHLGLIRDPKVVFLSSVHHYYYDIDELKDVTTLINLRRLNHFEKIDKFLKSIFHALPQKANFIGCFEERNKPLDLFRQKNSLSGVPEINQDNIEDGIFSNIPIINMLYSFFDAKTYNVLSRDTVASILKQNGFQVQDFTVLLGLTYFHAINNQSAGN